MILTSPLGKIFKPSFYPPPSFSTFWSTRGGGKTSEWLWCLISFSIKFTKSRYNCYRWDEHSKNKRNDHDSRDRNRSFRRRFRLPQFGSNSGSFILRIFLICSLSEQSLNRQQRAKVSYSAFQIKHIQEFWCYPLKHVHYLMTNNIQPLGYHPSGTYYRQLKNMDFVPYVRISRT